MPTLIIVKGSKKILHRCDERCYNAISRPCRCICKGRNHGVGLKQALINTARLAENYPKATEPSLFHRMTDKLLDSALQCPNIIAPLVIRQVELTQKKEGG